MYIRLRNEDGFHLRIHILSEMDGTVSLSYVSSVHVSVFGFIMSYVMAFR